MIIINILHFNDYEDMALAVSNKYKEITSKDELDSIGIVAKYEDAREILSNLISMNYDIGRIEIYDELDNGYADEFEITIFDNAVWCSPTKDENKYLNLEDDYVYLLDNCNSKIIPHIEAKEIYEVEIGVDEEEDCDCCCEHCNCHKDDNATCNVFVDEDDNVTGFEVHKNDKNFSMEFSYHSFGDEFLSEDEVRTILKFFA